MSQYSLATTDPLRKGSREQAKKIRLPWRVDNGVREQRLYDVGAASLIFDAGTIDTKSSSRANTKTFWSRMRTQDVGDDAKTPTQHEIGPAAVLGEAIFESPPVSRAGTADGVEMRGHVSGEPHANSDAPPQSPTLEKSQRGWKIPSPLVLFASRARYHGHPGGDCHSETEQQPATPTTLLRMLRQRGAREGAGRAKRSQSVWREKSA